MEITSGGAIFVAVVAARVLVPLAIPRYPLPAMLAALVIDGIDQTIFQTFTTLDLSGYQAYDKALDVYYLSIAYIATMRNWTNFDGVRGQPLPLLLPARRRRRVRADPDPGRCCWSSRTPSSTSSTPTRRSAIALGPAADEPSGSDRHARRSSGSSSSCPRSGGSTSPSSTRPTSSRRSSSASRRRPPGPTAFANRPTRARRRRRSRCGRRRGRGLVGHHPASCRRPTTRRRSTPTRSQPKVDRGRIDAVRKRRPGASFDRELAREDRPRLARQRDLRPDAAGRGGERHSPSPSASRSSSSCNAAISDWLVRRARRLGYHTATRQFLVHASRSTSRSSRPAS